MLTSRTAHLNATDTLLAHTKGNADATAQLTELVYKELRRLAASFMRSERSDHTLQPTALVHEAFIRLIDGQTVAWRDEVHFKAVAARTMQRVLIDAARSRNAARRKGRKVSLSAALPALPDDSLDIVALDAALEKLNAQGPRGERQGRIVVLHIFGGLTFREIATALDVSERTAHDDWYFARVWLYRELNPSGAEKTQ